MRIRFLFVAPIAARAGAALAATDPPACTAIKGQGLAVGDYLETGYMETLRESRSPLAAVELGHGASQMVRVTLENNALTLLVVLNWHEGEWLFHLHPDGRIERNMDWGGALTASLDVLNSCSFRLSAPNEALRTYRYVGSDQNYIGKVALAGSYADEQGRKFDFGEDGTAVFPDQTFHYTVTLDQVIDQYDFFQVGDAMRYIAFRRTGSDLVLYPVELRPPDGGPFGTPDFKHPIARLQPIAAP
jgi:hypothetical protein